MTVNILKIPYEIQEVRLAAFLQIILYNTELF